LDWTSFYEWKRRFQPQGFEGLKDLLPVHKSHPLPAAPPVMMADTAGQQSAIHTLGHVWMPPLMQGFSERFEHVIECGHVSGLFVRR
jgi:hypothetical protein